MPGEVEEPSADEAAPQIAQASETSQAEGEPDTWGEAAVETDAVPAESAEIGTYEAPDTGGDETAVATGDAGEMGADYSARPPSPLPVRQPQTMRHASRRRQPSVAMSVYDSVSNRRDRYGRRHCLSVAEETGQQAKMMPRTATKNRSFAPPACKMSLPTPRWKTS